MSNMNIDEAIASGDPELIEKAMQAMGSSPGDDDPKEVKPEPKQEPIQEPLPAEKIEDVISSAPSDAEKTADARAAILSKDGNHFIPFKVLEGTREQVKGLSEQLAKAQEELAKLKKPASDGSAAIEELKELSPEVADAFMAMQQRVADAEARAGNALTPDQIEALVAKAATPDLVRWEKSDPDRYALAVQIDNALMNHPDYQSKTTAERFADVVQMVKGEYGELVTEKPKVDPVAEKAAAIVAKHTQEATGLPKTLTDVGAQHSSAQRSTEEIWAEKSADQIAKDMENMSQEQINQILAKLV